jgi:hypothetical protein
MEVHAHTHTARKKWTHYLWEFLMLFLAVFCGFLAEYQLEHSIERQRAKDFAVSLQRDLAADTSNFNITITNLTICGKKIDTLIELLSNPEKLQENTLAIYQNSVYAFIFPGSQANESTLQQLLNSGSLRYFKNNQLVDSIKLYNLNIQRLKDFNEAVTVFNIEFRKAQLKIVEINPILNFITNNNFLVGSTVSVDTSFGFFKNKLLLSSDNLSIKEYANWCAMKKFYMLNSAAYTTRVKEYAIALLQILNK